ncbi:AAA family ATPase [Candidatus Wolfebacteria bacterium]|nr:AAA family ATPase [Candidatus Wolfebacteria bacterium]
MRQEEALDILKMGHTAFITGSAGSGKTFLVNRFIDWLAAVNVPYAVTASTGIAATHLGGQTVHSWSGLGVRKRLADEDIPALERNKRLAKRWRDTAVLIIDEVSMLSAEQLDALSAIGKVLRMSDKPFGDMTVVFAGDFFQLPPVTREDEEPARFAYEAEAWHEAKPVVCYLETRERHKEDERFAEMLNDIRAGSALERVRAVLEERHTARSAVGEGVTRLYAHNKDVDAENEEKLATLSGSEKIYEMRTKGGSKLVEALKRGCLAPENLRLKVGAEVLFVKNDSMRTYVNGTRGVVESLDGAYPLVRTRSGRKVVAEPVEWRIEEHGAVRARITQVPLRLAWALTVHKSQGLTLDEAYVELSGAFVPGQGYVALSRVRSLQGLYLGSLNDTALAVDDAVRRADAEFQTRSSHARARLALVSNEEREKRHKEFVRRHKGTYIKDALPRHPALANAARRAPTHHRTHELLMERKSVNAIAQERGVSAGTIFSHIEKLLEEGVPLNLSHLKLAPDDRALAAARCAADKHGWERLVPLREYIEKMEGKTVSYDTLRLIRIYELWRKMHTG